MKIFAESILRQAEVKGNPAAVHTGYQMAEVLLGAPSHNCQGMGICRVVMVDQERPLLPKGDSCNRAWVLIGPREGRHCCLYFLKKSMCKKMKVKYFSDGFFLVEESSLIELGPARKLKLTPGGYQILETEDYFIIRFSFQE